jgi:hypothetical protein
LSPLFLLFDLLGIENLESQASVLTIELPFTSISLTLSLYSREH